MDPCLLSIVSWIPTLLSLVATVVSVMAWSKSRVIYGVETIVLRRPTGGHDDLVDEKRLINEKLSSGHFAILSVLERRDNDVDLLLGKLVE